MSKICKINEIFSTKTTLEGAGVTLERAFGYYETPLFDPFLLLDHFGSKDPKNYIKGFPWHPHRGIDTVTYMLEGEVEHQDSLGNKGIIEGSDIQWMTAGSGIIHQEMPLENKTNLEGFQLWVNLPASHKMTDPQYRSILKTDIPTVKTDNAIIKIIAGEFLNTKGILTDIIVETNYLDIEIKPKEEFVYTKSLEFKTFAYVYRGSGFFSNEKTLIDSHNTVLFSEGDTISIKAGNQGIKILLVSGKPLNEPIAWRGPIVMNTDKELHKAFEEYRNGNFIK